jgi:DnaK suppressor protein
MSFSADQLTRFHTLLTTLRQTLIVVEETGGEAAKVVELDQARVGRLSRMDALAAQAMSLETGRRRKQQLLKIDAALERIDDDEYGQCFECGEPINPKRLEANPTATMCIHCAEAFEQH